MYCVNNTDLYQKTMDGLGDRGKSRASSSIAINSGQDISEVVVLVGVRVRACVRWLCGEKVKLWSLVLRKAWALSLSLLTESCRQGMNKQRLCNEVGQLEFGNHATRALKTTFSTNSNKDSYPQHKKQQLHTQNYHRAATSITCSSRFCFLRDTPSSSRRRLISSVFKAVFLYRFFLLSSAIFI